MLNNALLQLMVRAQTLVQLADDRDRDRDRGATAVEYGLLLAAIVAVVGVAVWQLSGTVKGWFDATNTAVKK